MITIVCSGLTLEELCAKFIPNFYTFHHNPGAGLCWQMKDLGGW